MSDKIIVDISDDAPVEVPEAVVEEAVVEEVVEEVVAEKEEVEAKSAEDKAKELGWKPGVTNKHGETLDAEEYLGRKPLFAKIDELNNVVTGLSKKMAKAQAEGYKKAVADLEAQRNAAIEDNDLEQFTALDNQVVDARKQYEESVAEVATHDPKSEDYFNTQTSSFTEHHKEWFNTDNAENARMTIEADRFFKDTLAVIDSVDRSLELTEEHIKSHYPHRFEGATKKAERVDAKYAAVAGPATARADKRNNRSVDDLSDMQRQTFNVIKKDFPEFTVDEYLNVSGGNKIKLDI